MNTLAPMSAPRVPPSTTVEPETCDKAVPDDTSAKSMGRRGWFVRWLKTLPKKLALAGVAVLVTLVALEVVFRLFGYRPLYDEYSKPSLLWRHDRVLGWSLKPRSRGEFVGPVALPIEFRTQIRVN